MCLTAKPSANGNGSALDDARLALMDTFSSFLGGFGIAGKDKSIDLKPTLQILGIDDLHALYRGDWVSRKICDTPPADATRSWRKWSADHDDVKKIEAAERALGLQRKLELAMCRARLLGGAAILIGSSDNDFNTILDYDKIKKGDLKFVHVAGRYNIVAGPLIKDITSPWYGEPEFYYRTNIVSAGYYEQELKPPPQTSALGMKPGEMFTIHPSRVLRFIGNEYPDMEMAPDSWGDSVLQTIYDAIRNAGLATSSVAQLIAEAKLDIIKVNGLTQILSTEAGSTGLTRRFQYTNAAKSVLNSILIDSEEDWQCRQLNLSTLDKILGMFFALACGAADIPATRLLGKSPDGMNATGDSDTRNYYDRLASDQNVKLRPIMTRLDEVLLRSVFGKRPEDVDYVWNPLWQMTEAEKAELALKKGQTFMLDVQAGMIPHTALAQARVNQLIEDNFYPGLEGALDAAEEAGDTLMEPMLPTPQGGPETPPGGLPSGEAGPGGEEGSGEPGGPEGEPPLGGADSGTSIGAPFYRSTSELPGTVKELPGRAAELWRKTFNAAIREYTEREAEEAAWAAVGGIRSRTPERLVRRPTQWPKHWGAGADDTTINDEFVWKEELHKRTGKGSPGGGRFTSGSSGSSSGGSGEPAPPAPPAPPQIKRAFGSKNPTLQAGLQQHTAQQAYAKAVEQHEAAKASAESNVWRESTQKEIDRVAKEAGFDSKKIKLQDGRATQNIMNKTYNTLAHARSDGTIEVFGPALEKSGCSVGGILHHEMQHAKFNAALDATDPLAKAAMEKAFYSKPLKAFSDSDGVTDYSRKWWQAYRNGEADYLDAVHETLAEMARVKYEGMDVIHAHNTSEGKENWRELYNTVEKFGK